MNELFLFDRGYPCRELIAKLIGMKVHFVMRLKSGTFSNEIDKDKKDQIIEISYARKKYKVRVIKFKLDSGIEEILITNLFDTSINEDNFKQLYFMRWGIEIKYDELKNRLEIENFTGTTKIAIEQDFYASIYFQI